MLLIGPQTVTETGPRHPDRPAARVDPPPHALVRAVVSAGQVAADAEWTGLTGGRTNRLWRVGQGAQARVVKLYTAAAATPLFANDPVAEALVLRALRGRGLAPDPVHQAQTEDGFCLIYTHQDGLPWRSCPAPVAQVLKDLHGLPVTGGLTGLPLALDGSEALAAQTLAILDQIPPDRAAPLHALCPEGQVLPSGCRSLLHGDPVPDNLVCPPGQPEARPILIDWQCPALGDPVLDLALFLSPAMQQVTRGAALSSQERRAFLDAYADTETETRLNRLTPWLHWRMAAYCLWKITRPTPDPAYAAALVLECAALGGRAP